MEQTIPILENASSETDASPLFGLKAAVRGIASGLSLIWDVRQYRIVFHNLHFDTSFAIPSAPYDRPLSGILPVSLGIIEHPTVERVRDKHRELCWIPPYNNVQH